MDARDCFDLYMHMTQEDDNISASNLDPDRQGMRGDSHDNDFALWSATFAINFERYVDEMQRNAMILAWNEPNNKLKAIFYEADKGFNKLDHNLPEEVVIDGEKIRRRLFS